MKTITELKEKSLFLGRGNEIYFPYWSGMHLTARKLETEALEQTYAFKDGIIAFIDKDKNFFVIPDLIGVQKILKNNGYQKDEFYVPLHNYEMPHDTYLQSKWKNLVKERRKQKREKRKKKAK